jgi:hypothetical protein
MPKKGVSGWNKKKNGYGLQVSFLSVPDINLYLRSLHLHLLYFRGYPIFFIPIFVVRKQYIEV